VFLYEKVLGLDLPWLAGIGRPQAPRRLPVVLSHGEVAAVLSSFAAPEHRLFAELLYGTGMRLMEGLRLRVKDVEFEHRAIVVREDLLRLGPSLAAPAAAAHTNVAGEHGEDAQGGAPPDGVAAPRSPGALKPPPPSVREPRP